MWSANSQDNTREPRRRKADECLAIVKKSVWVHKSSMVYWKAPCSARLLLFVKLVQHQVMSEEVLVGTEILGGGREAGDYTANGTLSPSEWLQRSLDGGNESNFNVALIVSGKFTGRHSAHKP